MAIRLTHVKVYGQRALDEKQVKAARLIEKILKKNGITAEVTISRYYADRWYSPERILQLVIEEIQDRRDRGAKFRLLKDDEILSEALRLEKEYEKEVAKNI